MRLIDVWTPLPSAAAAVLNACGLAVGSDPARLGGAPREPLHLGEGVHDPRRDRLAVGDVGDARGLELGDRLARVPGDAFRKFWRAVLPWAALVIEARLSWLLRFCTLLSNGPITEQTDFT